MVHLRSNGGRCMMYMSCTLSIHCILMRGASTILLYCNITHNVVFHLCNTP